MVQRQEVAKVFKLGSLQIRYGGNSGLYGSTPNFGADKLRQVFLKMGRNSNIYKLHLDFVDENGVPGLLTLREVDGEWFLYGHHYGEDRMTLPTSDEFAAYVLELPGAKRRLEEEEQKKGLSRS